MSKINSRYSGLTVSLTNFDLFFAFLISVPFSWFNYDNAIAIRCIYSISLNFWEGVMAQAYHKLLKNLSYWNFLQIVFTATSSYQCAANIRPKKLLKSSLSLSSLSFLWHDTWLIVRSVRLKKYRDNFGPVSFFLRLTDIFPKLTLGAPDWKSTETTLLDLSWPCELFFTFS